MLGEAGFKILQPEIQVHAAVELGFLARTGAEAGHLAGETVTKGEHMLPPKAATPNEIMI